MLGYTKAYDAANIRVEKELGSGGYGKVYLCCLRSAPDKKFAIKRLLVRDTTDFFLSWREADIVKKLQHPYTITMIGYCTNDLNWNTPPPPGERDDDLCMMFPVAVCDLEDMPRKTEKETLGMLSQILSGVAHVHSCGYFHRDIKPSNLLLMPDGAVKLCDFGVSEKMVKNNYVSVGIGSFLFRAPEMLFPTGLNYYESDIWSLGCVFYYMLSGAYVALRTQRPADHTKEMQNIVDGYPYPFNLSEDCRMQGVEYRCVSTLLDFEGKITVPLASPSVTRRYLSKMLALDPRDRPSAADLLAHAYLRRHRTDTAPLDDVAPPLETRVMKSCNATVMAHVQRHVFDVFFACSSASWYRDSVIFTALVIFDRLVSGAEDKFLACDPADWGKYFKTCLYISAKYYAAAHDYDLRYRDFAMERESSSTLAKAAEFERAVMIDLGGWVYDVSLYDLLLDDKNPSFEEIFCLLLFVVSGAYDGKTAKEAYTRWSREYAHQVILARQHPRYPR